MCGSFPHESPTKINPNVGRSGTPAGPGEKKKHIRAGAESKRTDGREWARPADRKRPSQSVGRLWLCVGCGGVPCPLRRNCLSVRQRNASMQTNQRLNPTIRERRPESWRRRKNRVGTFIHSRVLLTVRMSPSFFFLFFFGRIARGFRASARCRPPATHSARARRAQQRPPTRGGPPPALPSPSPPPSAAEGAGLGGGG